MTLTRQQALALRMRNLGIGPEARSFGSVADVVTWFGAMQAQEINSGLWSLGVRLPGWNIDRVREALEERTVVRTWPMRGTVHWVPAADAKWMLELTGAKALAGAARRREYHGFDEETANRAVEALRNALAEGGRLTRAECLAAIEKTGAPVKGGAGYHFLWYASQLGVSCIAPNRGSEQTFVLLDEWVPEPNRPSREEALATLALRYFRSHGPTTGKDFAGWTGLNLTESRQAVAEAGDSLVTVEVDGTEMVTAPVDEVPSAPPPEVLVLPGFDEYLLGYKERSLMLDDEHMQAIVPGRNGVFRPTIVRDGRVIGTWKRKSRTQKRTVLEAKSLVRVTKRGRREIEEAFEVYADYLGDKVELVWE